MADDLGDIWWETGEAEQKSESKKDKVTKKAAPSLSPKEETKKSLKRKKSSDPEAAAVSAKSRKTDSPASSVGKTAVGSAATKEGDKGKENRKKKQKKKAAKSKGKANKDGAKTSEDASSSESKPAKKKERKRISEVPDEELSRPGTAEDLRSVMTKQLKDRLGEDALEDILPNPDTDFFSFNEKSEEPSEYLKSILPSWREVVKKSLFLKNMGSPSLLIITSSAIRAVDLNREVKDFVTSKCKVAKLFAKHMKLEDQKKFLAKTNIQVGIGTPGRISQLIKQGGLQLESLVAVVFDWNWRDQKLKRMVDIPEVRAELVTLIKDFFVETVQGSSCKFGLL